jgi:hypothetical protein
MLSRSRFRRLQFDKYSERWACIQKQGLRIWGVQRWSWRQSVSQLLTLVLACEFFFYHEDGGDAFLRNVGSYKTHTTRGSYKTHTTPHPRRRHSSRAYYISEMFRTIRVRILCFPSSNVKGCICGLNFVEVTLPVVLSEWRFGWRCLGQGNHESNKTY